MVKKIFISVLLIFLMYCIHQFTYTKVHFTVTQVVVFNKTREGEYNVRITINVCHVYTFRAWPSNVPNECVTMSNQDVNRYSGYGF